MNKRSKKAAALVLAAVACAVAPVSGAHAQYALDSSAITAGAAVGMIGGAFTLSAGVETPAAGPSQGGTFGLWAGFWCTPGAAVVDVPPSQGTVPLVTALLGAAPSPFPRETSVAFDLAAAGSARVDVFDVAGRRVRTLLDGSRASGRYHLTWSGDDDAGRPVASGVYIIRLQGGGVSQTKRVLKIR